VPLSEIIIWLNTIHPPGTNLLAAYRINLLIHKTASLCAEKTDLRFMLQQQGALGREAMLKITAWNNCFHRPMAIDHCMLHDEFL